jgi:hypothetical protein
VQLRPNERGQVAPAELVVDDPELCVVAVKEFFVGSAERDITGRADFVTVVPVNQRVVPDDQVVPAAFSLWYAVPPGVFGQEP